VEASGDAALTAATHKTPEGVPGPVELHSTKAHLSLLETSSAAFAIVKDTSTSPSPSGHPVPARHKYEDH